MGIDAICLNFSGNLATNVVVVGQEIIKDSYDGCTCVSGSTQWHRYRNGRSIRPFKPASIILEIDSPIGLTIEATYQPAVEKDIERRVGGFSRSEEHTSELQSLMRISYAVFCLKKNT